MTNGVRLKDLKHILSGDTEVRIYRVIDRMNASVTMPILAGTIMTWGKWKERINEFYWEKPVKAICSDLGKNGERSIIGIYLN